MSEYMIQFFDSNRAERIQATPRMATLVFSALCNYYDMDTSRIKITDDENGEFCRAFITDEHGDCLGMIARSDTLEARASEYINKTLKQ